MVRPAYSDINDSLFFSSRSSEARYLREQDADWELIFDLVEDVSVDIELDGFIALARAIVDQQISIHAARAIWGRLVEACKGRVSAESLDSLSLDELRAIGVSARKASYLQDLAAQVQSGALNFDALQLLSDEDVIAELIKVRGIGRWTAEMYLIFSLKRLDVFALDDGGLRRAVAAFKGVPSDVPAHIIDDFAGVWSPYRTVAALFLWKWISVKS